MEMKMKSPSVLFAALLLGLAPLFASGQASVASRPFPLSTVKDASKRKPAGASLLSLPLAAQSGISAALGRDLRGYQARVQGGGFEAQNAQHRLAATFTSEGVAVRNGGALWRVALRGYGYGNALRAVDTAAPEASVNRVEYGHGPLTEWYLNGPLGLEQGFTLSEPPGPADGQPLTIALALSGDLTAAVDQSRTGLTLTSRQGEAELRYSGLAAHDATGRELPAWLELQGERLLLKVDDTKTRYPVVIDPWVQLAELTASDGAAGDSLGFSVATTNTPTPTVVVGAPYATIGTNGDQGAAYVFVEPKRGWSSNMTQTAKLTASDGRPGDTLGWCVSISGSKSGSTVVASAPGARVDGHAQEGAVYVFVEPSKGWPATMTQTGKLTARGGKPGDWLGYSVSISGDTVVAGAPEAAVTWDEQGEVYVFVAPRGWRRSMTQTAELTVSNGAAQDRLGWSVAVSGGTVVAGAPDRNIGSNPAQGAAYVFLAGRNGLWKKTSHFNAELTASDGEAGDYLGWSVSVDDTTVVAGAPYATVGSNPSQGAAYVFVKPANGWASMFQTAELYSSDGQTGDAFGYSVAISGDTAVAGAPNATVSSSSDEGAVYFFVKPKSGWANMYQTGKLTTSDGATGDYFGAAASISGSIISGGAYGKTIGSNSGQGAAYVFGNGSQGAGANH